MYAEKAVIPLHHNLMVHSCYYPDQAATGTVILVNGSLPTSAKPVSRAKPVSDEHFRVSPLRELEKTGAG